MVIRIERWTYRERQQDAWKLMNCIGTVLPTRVATICCKLELFKDHLVTIVLES